MLELSIYDNLLLTLLSFFTAMITSIAGAGGGTVLLAAMLQFMNPSEAIPVHGVIQFTSNIARTWLLRKFVKWSIILKFSLMIPLGVYIGLEIFQSINAEDIKKLIEFALGFKNTANKTNISLEYLDIENSSISQKEITLRKQNY